MGSTVLGIAEIAGIIAAVVSVAGTDDCLVKSGGTCIEQRQTNWVATGVYGGLGIAALGAAIVWLVAGTSNSEPEGTATDGMVTPGTRF